MVTCLVRQFLLQHLNLTFIPTDRGTFERAEERAEARFTDQGRRAYFLKEKCSLLEGCACQKAKTAAHTHATMEDFSDFVTFSDLKRY